MATPVGQVVIRLDEMSADELRDLCSQLIFCIWERMEPGPKVGPDSAESVLDVWKLLPKHCPGDDE
jgi:hypothetical protein